MPDPGVAQSLFDRAMDRPESERTAFVRAAAGVDAALAERVLGMLERHAELPTEIPAPVDRRSPDLPDRIGRYRILGVLGEGGFGDVYEADQTEPVRRRVALKVIKAGMDSKAVVARFEAERQALAVMDHPCVATVLDGGVTEPEHGSRPYFVMELVRGAPITSYCDRERLSIEARVALFIRVCHAVQHAHSKGVIHRDLKPANILVAHTDEGPVPKVIDFGVAKALSQKLTEATIFTGQGQMIGTPEYMSPEQAEMSGVDIDTRTDVYSLGVVLYELFSGWRPFEGAGLRERGFAEVQRIILEEEPPKPSTRICTAMTRDAAIVGQLAGNRQAEPRQLERRLRGELDWVVMKCMSKERERRYATAAELGEELERYLAGGVISARPPSRIYRARKFVRRNKAGVGAAVVAGLALAGAAGVSLAFALQAETARGRAELALVDRDKALGAERDQREAAEAAQARAELAESEIAEHAAELEQVTRFQSSMISEIAPELMGQTLIRALGESVQRSVVLEGGSADAALTEFEGVMGRADLTGASLRVLDEHVLSSAVEAIDREFGQEPRIDAALRQTVADAYRSFGLHDQAEPLQVAALETRRRELGDEHPLTLESINNAGLLLKRQRRFEEAEALYREALEARRRVLGEGAEETISTTQNLALLLLETGQAGEAGALFEAALDSGRESLGESHPETLTALHNLAYYLERAGRPDDAAAHYREAIRLRGETLGPDDLGRLSSLNNLGDLLRRQRRYDEAAAALEESLSGRRRAFGNDHQRTIFAMGNLGRVYLRQERFDEADALISEAFETSRRVLGEDHHDSLIALDTMGLLRRRQARHAEAVELYTESLERLRRVYGPRHPDTVGRMTALLGTLGDAGRYNEAEPLAREAIEATDEVFGPTHARAAGVRRLLAGHFADQGRLDESAALYREALDRDRAREGADARRTVSYVDQTATRLESAGRFDLAEPVWAEQIVGLRADAPDATTTLASALVRMAMCQIELQNEAAAEDALVECLAIRETVLSEDDWLLWNTRNLLGASIAAQGRFAEAEALLVESAERIEPPASLGAGGERRVQDAIRRTVALYEAWHAAEPDAGHEASAARWRARLGNGGGEAGADDGEG